MLANRKGFTVIEFIVVMVIFGIFSAFIISLTTKDCCDEKKPEVTTQLEG